MGEALSCTRGMFPQFGTEVRELSDREREILIEEAITAWRSRSPDGRTLEHHTWADRCTPNGVRRGFHHAFPRSRA
jgi:hypothetical protein